MIKTMMLGSERDENNQLHEIINDVGNSEYEVSVRSPLGYGIFRRQEGIH